MKKGALLRDNKIGSLEKALISALRDQNFSRQDNVPLDGSGLLARKYYNRCSSKI